ncbi:MAG: ATP-binding protein [Rubricoccaceae bacterium]|nr:ATP-binding protein [Rubricoccaceae bacterium]
MTAGLLHPLSLRFSAPAVESAFRADYVRRSLLLMRLALVLGLAQYAAFGALDAWVAGAAVESVRAIRVVVCVALALGIGATFVVPQRFALVPAAVVALLGGLGVAGMTAAVQHAHHLAGHALDAPLAPNGYYYAGVMLILVYVHALLRLRFVVATAVGAAMVVAYLAVESLHAPRPMLANSALYLLSAQFSGMVASYALERYARLQFHHARRQARTNRELTGALTGLKAAQVRLVQQEKMASLGRLTAGVAHEIKNPLNFVNNFAEMSEELATEIAGLMAGVEGPPDEATCAEVKALMADLCLNVAKIREHGARADAIVRSMQGHGGVRGGERQPAAFNALVEEQARLALDAYRARHAGLAPTLVLDLDPEARVVPVVPQEIGRVVTNLVNNALYAVDERSRHRAGGDGAPYAPTVTVRTRAQGTAAVLEVADNGVGIPAALRERVFEPFFTTKPTGTGTGLGLSLAYDVVTSGHGGTLALETEEGAGTTFTVTLPLEAPQPLALATA